MNWPQVSDVEKSPPYNPQARRAETRLSRLLPVVSTLHVTCKRTLAQTLAPVRKRALLLLRRLRTSLPADPDGEFGAPGLGKGEEAAFLTITG